MLHGEVRRHRLREGPDAIRPVLQPHVDQKRDALAAFASAAAAAAAATATAAAAHTGRSSAATAATTTIAVVFGCGGYGSQLDGCGVQQPPVEAQVPTHRRKAQGRPAIATDTVATLTTVATTTTTAAAAAAAAATTTTTTASG